MHIIKKLLEQFQSSQKQTIKFTIKNNINEYK